MVTIAVQGKAVRIVRRRSTRHSNTGTGRSCEGGEGSARVLAVRTRQPEEAHIRKRARRRTGHMVHQHQRAERDNRAARRSSVPEGSPEAAHS
jgi:hypothetical protein